ncbi:MAG TPA: 4-(cytidine 5'-diphospho)-2-C-methyl-D-erythritol kinase [Thermoanaerobaculia bacterium]|jgi:4-diphosphocytidyl-2-C-methyl-D-erythritol kinase|nr:4-(cytidine 5'-diphospho)-2-C-methyl-D-erythritol kinase [Thermoanaerobaculia bacterium]
MTQPESIIEIPAYAKINWSLRITGERPDGFHDLETLFQTISLHDKIAIRESDRFSLTCNDPSIPVDDTNLVLRAARALGTPPVAIDLKKSIPAGGGLGGGSSDAAAVLVALSKHFGIDKPLAKLALDLGSDVPFFLTGGTAYATGRGEVLTPMPPVAGIPLLLLIPKERVSTANAFAALRRFSRPIGIDRYRSIIDDGLLHDAGELTNDFEEPIFVLLPRLRELKARLLDAGAVWSAMSGSGSTIVAAFAETKARDAAIAKFSDVRAVASETK